MDYPGAAWTFVLRNSDRIIPVLVIGVSGNGLARSSRISAASVCACEFELHLLTMCARADPLTQSGTHVVGGEGTLRSDFQVRG